jgi:hypothetical protein
LWGDLFDGDPPPGLAAIVHHVERRSALLWLWLGLLPAAQRGTYRDYAEGLLEYITSCTGRSWVVDSSKSAGLAAGRFLALHRLAGVEVCVIHLVRDGLATMESELVTGNNMALEGRAVAPRAAAVRTAVGWTLANLLVPVSARLLPPGRYLRLRYEDLAADPLDVLPRIGSFVGLDLGEVARKIAAGEAFPVGHAVGGNRARFAGAIRLHPPQHTRPGARLSAGQRLVFWLIGGWLQTHYGYRAGR